MTHKLSRECLIQNDNDHVCPPLPTPALRAYAEQLHEGEQDIPRADALRFGHTGGPLRRSRILLATHVKPIFRVYREYPESTSATTSSTRLSSGSDDAHASPAHGAESVAAGGGYWVLDIAGKRMALMGIRADPTQKRGLLFQTVLDGEIEAICEEKEAFRMWMGVAAVVNPSAGRSE